MQMRVIKHKRYSTKKILENDCVIIEKVKCVCYWYSGGGGIREISLRNKILMSLQVVARYIGFLKKASEKWGAVH